MHVIDDFLKDPYQIRALALSSTLGRPPHSYNWPGYRANIPQSFSSSYLKKINSVLNEELEFKYAYFQSIGEKWVAGAYHADLFCKWTALTFLNTNPPLNSGIEIGEEQTAEYIESIFENGQQDINTFDSYMHIFNESEKNSIQKFFFERKLKEYNSHYKNPCVVSNKFNRTVIFKGNRTHCAQKFFGNRPADSRLTIISFLS
tara:strand:+ start:82 stop:690 length:609 start_codon:yes stop_codon:yes gene_type:complete